ncbi:cytochrome P450 [Actinosynnema sp. CS-041913]|uniref:cytochrome P450 n=1 Tax=Actinosynnema sp. CS-041913 TaxID=3239917 RepID=UPI003D90D91D
MSTEEPVPYPFARPAPLEVPVELATARDRPVIPVRLPSGDHALLVTRYEDVRAVLTDPRVSRNLNRPDAARMTSDNKMFQDPGMDPDPPEHTRVRRLVMKAFTATMVENMRPRVQEIVDELVTKMANGPRPADVSEALAFPLAIRVVCDLLGVPVEDQERFRGWTDKFLSTGKYGRAEIQTAMGQLGAYMGALIEAKRAAPADDLISELTRVHDNDDVRLSEYELHWWCRLLLLVGYETTASQIGYTVAKVLAHPDQFAALRANPALVPNAVEEVLRWKLINGSLSMLRYVTEDIEVGGVRVPKGTSVIPSVESANWDETVFARAGEFDVSREDNQHVTFSVGPHFCVGASLARLELRVVLETLLRRFPNLRLAVSVDALARVEGTLIGGLTAVPVDW